MIHILGLLITMVIMSGCELHHPQTLSKNDLRKHLGTYVNTPNYLFGNAQLPGNVTYRSLNRAGVSVKEQGDEIKLVLPVDLFFENNSYEIESSKFATLNLIATIIKAIEEPVVIIGNTDNIGNKQDKMMMSKKLAESIKNHLWKNGVEQNRIITIAAADSRPISSQSVKGKVLNRRVEIQMRRT